MGVAALVGVVRARSQLVALLVLLPAAVGLAAHEQPAHQAQSGVGGGLVGGKARAFVIHRLRHRLTAGRLLVKLKLFICGKASL